MPGLQTIKAAIFGSDSSETYRCECTVCNATFFSDEPTVQSVSCPQCGAHSIGERLTVNG